MPKLNPLQQAIKKDKVEHDLKKQATEFGYSEYPIADIKITGNPRKHFNDKKLAELAASIKESGLLQPIVIDDNLQLIAGERRLRACMLLGFAKIKAVKYNGLEKNNRVLSILENLQREGLSTTELRAACHELSENGIKQVDIARKLGVSRAWVSELISGHVALKAAGRAEEKISAHAARGVKKTKMLGMPNISKSGKTKPQQLDLFNYKSFASIIKRSHTKYSIQGNKITITFQDKERLAKLREILAAE